MSKKSKIVPEIHEYFDDYNPGSVAIMIDFMKMQHNCALELTKAKDLILIKRIFLLFFKKQ